MNSNGDQSSESRASELSGHSQHHLEDKTEHSAHRSILKVYPRLKINRTFSNICFFLSFKCYFTSYYILNSILCGSIALLRWRSNQGKVHTLRLLCENTEENKRIASCRSKTSVSHNITAARLVAQLNNCLPPMATRSKVRGVTWQWSVISLCMTSCWRPSAGVRAPPPCRGSLLRHPGNFNGHCCVVVVFVYIFREHPLGK